MNIDAETLIKAIAKLQAGVRELTARVDALEEKLAESSQTDSFLAWSKMKLEGTNKNDIMAYWQNNLISKEEARNMLNLPAPAGGAAE